VLSWEKKEREATSKHADERKERLEEMQIERKGNLINVTTDSLSISNLQKTHKREG